MRPTPYRRQTNRAGAALTCAVLAALVTGCAAGPAANNPRVEGSDDGLLKATAAAPATQEAAAQAANPAATSSAAGREALANTSAGASTSAAAAADAAATETVKRTVTDTLAKLATGTPKPATAQVSDALTGAGIAPAVLQVSQSRTPTGLEADAIEAAVLQGKDCVIGQVREGAVTVTVLPVLASGKCFVGS
ncbi:DUF6993 domain-containing protein [Pseudarthrobacter sp. LT1]|uniref:DUF6993 domain-containing protein n=1 Tax=Pseudarthrobacter sp. LT1 TaxID=3111450 RepID=UPI002D774D93|nr:hypothetical protein [Pseudarthrobacter sp. LT1]WRT12239.1 hypothetical protein VIK36_12715 [Pseudarthrobacter sp. LT1]